MSEKKEAYPNHPQKNTDGTKNGLGWGHARELLGEAHGLDCRVQQGEGIILTFLSSGTRVHGRNSSRGSWEEAVLHEGCAEGSEP